MTTTIQAPNGLPFSRGFSRDLEMRREARDQMAPNMPFHRNGSAQSKTAATEEIATILEKIPFFAGLRPEHREELAQAVIVARYLKNQVLFVEGQPSRSLYFILRGRVKVYRLSSDGREQILHVLGDGEPIAVVPFFDGDGYPANAELMEDSEVAFIRYEDFTRIGRAHPEILLSMLQVLARRVRQTQEEVTELSLKSVTARLAGRLMDLAERYGTQVENGIEINLQLSRQEMGSLIGASRETTTRLLHQFKREGVLEIDGSQIVILKPLILQSWSEV